MASIQTRPTAAGSYVYRVLYRLEGKQTSDTFPTHDEAENHRRRVDQFGPAEARAWVIRQAHATARPDHHTLATWTTAYLASASGITEGTRAEYARLAARTFLPHLGGIALDSLTRDNVRSWVQTQSRTLTRAGTPTSSKTIANAHGLLSTTLARAVEDGLRKDNPSRGVKLPRGIREEMTMLSQNEFVELHALIDPHHRLFVGFLAATGMRFGEATALQWGDLDLDSHQPTARVVRAWKRGPGSAPVLGPPKTARARRTVSLPQQIATELRLLRGAPGDLVFRAKRGGQITNNTFHQNTWQPAVRAFAGDQVQLGVRSRVGRTGDRVVRQGPGKHPRVHDLRHSHASWLIADGVDPITVSRRLGHEKVSTTLDIYGHAAPDALERTADAASRAIAQAYPMMEIGS